MLHRYDLAAEDPQMLYALRSISPKLLPGPARGGRARWRTSGPGVVAFKGGVWESGVVFAPEFAIDTQSRVLAVTCEWDSDRLGEWKEDSRVRLLLFDVETSLSCVIDVTNDPDAAVIVPATLVLSANCMVIPQLKVGIREGKLLRPPYIRTVSTVVHYRD